MISNLEVRGCWRLGNRRNVVVVSWLFERAAHWILDRNAITGHVGEVLLKMRDEDEDDSDAEQAGDERR